MKKEEIDAYIDDQTKPHPDKNSLTARFEQLRAHYNCLNELERSNIDMSTTAQLREALKNTCFLLGLELHKNKSMLLEVVFMRTNTQRLRHEKLETEKVAQSKIQAM